VDDLESALEEAVENEDYELAAMLRDLNKDLTYDK
jgi:protein-arginine kinase activator protein McsA